VKIVRWRVEEKLLQQHYFRAEQSSADKKYNNTSYQSYRGAEI